MNELPGSNSNSNSSSSSSSNIMMSSPQNSNPNNFPNHNNMAMMNNNMSMNRRLPPIEGVPPSGSPLQSFTPPHQQPLPPYNYVPRGINAAGVEQQLSNIDREIRGFQQQQQDQVIDPHAMMSARSLTPDGVMNSGRSVFTPQQLHQFKEQVRRYRALISWTPTPPPSIPSPTLPPPVTTPPEPRPPARGRGSRGPRGSRSGQPRTRTNRPRQPKPTIPTIPTPQLPPPYIRYPTPYVRLPRDMRPQYRMASGGPYGQNDILDGMNMNMNNTPNMSMNMNHNDIGPPPGQNFPQQNQSQIQNPEDEGLIRSLESSHCSFCASFVAEGMGVSLQICFHTFCRPCLIASIEQSDAPQIPCPMQHEAQCGGYLIDPEIKALVSEEVYQAYLSRSLSHAIKSDNSLSQCFVPECSGVCVVEDGLQSFYCPVCSKLNCLNCKTTHDAPCEASKKRAGRPDDGYSYDIAMKRSRPETVGEAELRKDFESNWDQICAKFQSETDNCNNNGDGSNSAPGVPSESGSGSSFLNGSAIHNHNNIINHLEKSDLITTIDEFECSVCFVDVPKGEGVILQECLHKFCRDCLASTIEHCEKPHVKCPYQSADYACPMNLTDREIKALASKEVFERHLSRSVVSAEMTIANSFHCKLANCPGWVEVEDRVQSFQCPVCQKINCVPCKAIHEMISCSEYQSRLNQDECDPDSQKALNQLIQTGKAMRCPTCKVVITKNGGCDGMTCQICKTSLCWATKGPRWGPNGKGDTSGGCRCGFQGRRCHPKCSGCH